MCDCAAFALRFSELLFRYWYYITVTGTVFLDFLSTVFETHSAY